MFSQPLPIPVFEALSGYTEYPPEDMRRRAEGFYQDMRRRRTVREFSDRPVAREIIEHCLLAAGTAPSGANMQPWHFAVVSDPARKHAIRVGAEEEEREFYTHRASEEWLRALAPLGTDAHKPFLEIAPYLIAVFGQKWSEAEGERHKHYYVPESIGIACGLLIAALHTAGLATLTHTPSPMGFLNEILGRPSSEKPYMIIVTGYPAEDCQVPKISKKSLEEIASFL